MTEIAFLIKDDPEGGVVARAVGEAIFTQAESMKSLRRQVCDAVKCHFDDNATRPKLIRPHAELDM